MSMGLQGPCAPLLRYTYHSKQNVLFLIQTIALFLPHNMNIMPFPKIQLFIQSHSVDLCTATRVLFFEENWNLKIKAIVESKYVS